VPAYLGLTTERIPSEPYLRAPEALGVPIRRPPGTRLVVGLVWAGSPGYTPDLQRSAPFEAMLALTDLPGVTLVSLQKGDRVADIARAGMTGLVCDLSALLGDFADTAAALMQVDILVSVDTSVLHLAGALGRPAIALLPHWRCWRWMNDRTDTPWYPSIALATQETPGDWGGLLMRVRQMIEESQITAIEEGAECPTTMQALPDCQSANSSTSLPKPKRSSRGPAETPKATKPKPPTTPQKLPRRRSGADLAVGRSGRDAAPVAH
jgi:hypothetical protein